MTDTYMSIREMCDAFGVTPRALRFYESKELLSPVRQGTRRLFTHRDRVRLTLILRGKRYGFSLEDIRQLLDLYSPDSNDAQVAKAFALGQQKLAELKQQRDEIDKVIAELNAELSVCSKADDAVQAEAAA